MSISTIKAAIKTNLDELVVSEVLAGASVGEMKINPLDADIAAYPHAFLMPPSVQSEVLDNRTVTRTYTFTILTLFKGEDLEETADLETKIESVLSKFDNDPTLSGTALGGVLPVSSAPEPFQHNHTQLVAVEFNIEAKEVVSLSFA